MRPSCAPLAKAAGQNRSPNSSANTAAKGGAEDSIHVAARIGKIKAVQQHLDAGADVNAKDEKGSTPLYWAAWDGYKKVAELLIAKGADVNAKNNRGITPLDAAIMRSPRQSRRPSRNRRPPPPTQW